MPPVTWGGRDARLVGRAEPATTRPWAPSLRPSTRSSATGPTATAPPASVVIGKLLFFGATAAVTAPILNRLAPTPPASGTGSPAAGRGGTAGEERQEVRENHAAPQQRPEVHELFPGMHPTPHGTEAVDHWDAARGS